MFDCVKNFVRKFCPAKPKTFNREPRVLKREEHGIDPKLVSWQAKRTCEQLQKHGYKAYIVGGAVRDLLLGVRPKDFDVATDATPSQVKRTQRRALIIGRRFQIVHVMFGSEIIECSTFRALDAAGVRKDAEGRVVSDNVFGPMWQDAARRDFTVNALYYDPMTEEVFDYHDGFKDLKNRTLKIIGDPRARYREDPVRMMRAIRIAGKLGFSIDRATRKPISEMADLLRNVPAARLFDEMMKLFNCGKAEKCLRDMRESNLLHPLLPILDVILGEPQGEEFLMLAMHRTDERIAIGKKISPSFLFATLLWPQVKKRWEAYEARPNMPRTVALLRATEDVIANQARGFVVQNRFITDMQTIWLLQLRFERRFGKNPYTLVEHPKYRAAFDFMLLRNQLGHVDDEQVEWWKQFVAADVEARKAMVALETSKLPPRKPRRTRRSTNAEARLQESATPEAASPSEEVPAPKKRRLPRRRSKKLDVTTQEASQPNTARDASEAS